MNIRPPPVDVRDDENAAPLFFAVVE